MIKQSIKTGDFVLPNEQFKNLDNYFAGTPRKVLRVERVPLPYAGNAFVVVDIDGKEDNFYLSALKKVE